MTTHKTPLTLALGSALIAGALMSPLATAADNPFGSTHLSSGYQLADAGDKGGDAKCGAAKPKDASCGADKAKSAACGADKAKSASCGADKKKEARCGSDKKSKDAGCGSKS